MENLTKENFENFVLNNEVVVIDFWAPWCGPCKLMEDVVKEIENDFPNVKIGKVNVDVEHELSLKFGIRSIPTILIVKNQVIKKVINGAVPKQTFENEIRKVLEEK